MNILSIDASLSNTGFAMMEKGIIVTCCIGSKLRGIPRLIEIRDHISRLIDKTNTDIIFIEGYAYGSGLGGSRNIDLGELGGVLRVMFYEKGIPYVEIIPQHIKKFVTGKGNANKEMMMKISKEKYGIDFKNNDECDAYGMYLLGKEMVELGVEEALKKNGLAVTKKKYEIKFKGE